MIYAFDHKHRVGDICSREQCEYARRAPVLLGSEVFEDVPVLITGMASKADYLSQPIPDGWCIPPLEFGCDNLYKVELVPKS
jgi:hypothetical protein